MNDRDRFASVPVIDDYEGENDWNRIVGGVLRRLARVPGRGSPAALTPLPRATTAISKQTIPSPYIGQRLPRMPENSLFELSITKMDLLESTTKCPRCTKELALFHKCPERSCAGYCRQRTPLLPTLTRRLGF
jgi:hypothetical protein